MTEERAGRRDELRLARDGARRIVVNGDEWLVFEADDPYDRRRGPALVFESDDVIRRVRRFPPDWRSLDDGELLALSWSA